MHYGTCISVFLRNILHLSSTLYPIIIGTHPHNPENHNTKATSHMRWLNWKKQTNVSIQALSPSLSFLMIRIDTVLKTLVCSLFNHLIQLVAQESLTADCIESLWACKVPVLFIYCQHHTMKYKYYSGHTLT